MKKPTLRVDSTKDDASRQAAIQQLVEQGYLHEAIAQEFIRAGTSAENARLAAGLEYKFPIRNSKQS